MTPPPSLSELIQTVRQDSPTDASLDLLVTASATVSQIEERSDALMEHFIDRCRREGKSWSEISAALGVSKQAVHKRFSVPLADRLVQSVVKPTFERFTLRARGVVRAAVQGARQRGAAEVGPADLLAGLFAEPEGVAAKALAAMGVTADAVRAAAGTAAPGQATPPAPGAAPGEDAQDPRPPFGADARTALRDALAEALELGHNYIGTEHILLGLMRDPDAPVAGWLRSLGASPAEARVRVTEMLSGFTAQQAQPTKETPPEPA
jgi:ATP-dependent Clp protease ATP-binding subunit ClpA